MNTYTIRKELVKKIVDKKTTDEERQKLENIGQQLLEMDNEEIDYDSFFRKMGRPDLL